MRNIIGNVTIEYTTEGKITKANFKPENFELDLLQLSSLNDFNPSVEELEIQGISNVVAKAQVVFSRFFHLMTQIELDFAIKAECLECKHYDGTEQIKSCIVQFYY